MPNCGSEKSQVRTRTLSPRLAPLLCALTKFLDLDCLLQNKLPAYVPCALGTVDIGVQNTVALGPCSQSAAREADRKPWLQNTDLLSEM